MKFIITKELGRLSRWLRILGYDAEYFKSENKSTLIIKALQEGRIVITKNLKLGEHRGMRVIILKANSFKEQMKEVIKSLKLKLSKDKIFTRCLICNQRLEEINKEKIKDKVPAYVYKTQDEFVCCPECQRIYWQGTHWGNVREVLGKI